MTEKVLSQEEIDALLSAMDSGEVDLSESKAAPGEVKTYDLTSHSLKPLSQFDALKEIHDKWHKLMNRSVPSLLNAPIGVDIVATEMLKFGDLIQSFASPTNFSIFHMDPLIGTCLLAVEPDLVFSLIDCMFGGTGKSLNKVRDFTMIELRMMRKFNLEVLGHLEKAWEGVCPVSITIKKTESKPDFVKIASPNDLMITVIFSVSGEAFSGRCYLALPYLMLEPIKERLSTIYIRDTDREQIFTHHLRRLLQDTEVTLIAELGKAMFTVRDILNFDIDDVLTLNNGPADPINLVVEQVPKYRGIPGVVKGNRALQVAAFIQSNGDQHGSIRTN